MAALRKTREERCNELRRLAGTPNGINKVYEILTTNRVAFEKLPIGALLIETILNHEYPEQRVNDRGRVSTPKPRMTSAERFQQLWRLSAGELLKLFNGTMRISPGTGEDRGMPKESMVRSILLKEGFDKLGDAAED